MTDADPMVDLSFPHLWQAEILPTRPLILPPRHFIYPRDAEEIERGALEVLIRPGSPGFVRRGGETCDSSTTRIPSKEAQPFLATCALGFRDPAVPTGLWSCPNPAEVCAASGGYTYLIDTSDPERFTMIPFRPVLQIRAVPAEHLIPGGLLIFVGHHSVLAWSVEGEAWRSAKLSDEGITITKIESGILHGQGWRLMTDKESPFALDLRTGDLC